MALTPALGGSGGVGGSALTVKDEGTPLSTAVTSIDVVGAGATATNVGGAVTLTIPGYSAPAWVTYHPDTPPASPTLFSGTAYDQEFGAAGYVLGGTALGSPATAPAIVDHSLKIVGGTSSGFDLKGVEWPCPGSAFTVTAKQRRRLFNGQFHVAGLWVRAGASGAGNLAALTNYQDNNYATNRSIFTRYSNLTTRASFSGAGSDLSAQTGVIYWRIVYDGTNLSYQFSPTGHPDSFTTVLTETAATSIGAAPGRIVVTMDSQNASTPGVAYFDWIRFT